MIEPRRAASTRFVNIEFTPACGALQAVAAPEARAGAGATIDAIYIHTPFCFHKCHYCDFYSIVDDPAGSGTSRQDRQAPFMDALLAELYEQATRYDLRARTIFVGGGTPTLLRVELWQRLLEALRELRVLENVTEFTVEANPETVTAELAQVLVAGGVNRVSMGAQSFDPALLKALERWHDPASVARAAGRLREAGLRNLNLDLIFAIPGQTMEGLDRDVDAALALEPDHLSYYGLTYEPNTPMAVKLRLGRIDAVEEDLEAQMYERLLDRLDAAGFEHYEISNWARRGGETHARRCQHNLAYWHNHNWLGVGPSASSHVNGRRWKNEAHLGRYLAGSPTPPVVDVEELSPQRQTGEVLMLRLRLLEGVERSWLQEAIPADDARWQRIAEFVELNLLEWSTAEASAPTSHLCPTHLRPTHLRLTRRGLLVADALIARLL